MDIDKINVNALTTAGIFRIAHARARLELADWASSDEDLDNVERR